MSEINESDDDLIRYVNLTIALPSKLNEHEIMEALDGLLDPDRPESNVLFFPIKLEIDGYNDETNARVGACLTKAWEERVNNGAIESGDTNGLYLVRWLNKRRQKDDAERADHQG